MNADETSLRQWYEDHFATLFHADAKPRTLESYRATINAWERATTNPPLSRIDSLTLATFRASFKTKATAAKHCRQLNAMLAKLGPPGPRNRDALGIIHNCPWARPPRAEQRIPKVPNDALVVAMLLGAPDDLKLFTATAALTGTRNTAIRYMTPASINHQSQCISLPADTDKTRSERLKPIPNILLHWWTAFGHLHKRWRVSRSNFARRWNRWARKCGAAPLKPHALKRWWAAQLIRAGATVWAVRFALDHAQRDVTGIHYLAPFDELAGLVDRVILPSAFTEALDAPRQLHCPLPTQKQTRQDDTPTQDPQPQTSTPRTEEPDHQLPLIRFPRLAQIHVTL